MNTIGRIREKPKRWCCGSIRRLLFDAWAAKQHMTVGKKRDTVRRLLRRIAAGIWSDYTMTARQRVLRCLFLVAAAAFTIGTFGCAEKTPTLSLLVWEGYADPSYVHAFEESHNCKISASYMGSSDELVAKLRGGSASNYDVISPSSDVATMIASSGLAAPLDLSKLPTYPQLSERLRSMPLVRVNDNVYGVPFTWGPNPLLYDTTYFAKA